MIVWQIMGIDMHERLGVWRGGSGWRGGSRWRWWRVCVLRPVGERVEVFRGATEPTVSEASQRILTTLSCRKEIDVRP